ncbi:MAG: hypothetical protein ACYC9M_04685 [Desulfobulbaceae bacterium]
MPDHDRRRENRNSCTLAIGVFLSQGRDGLAVSPVFQGILTSITRYGAGIALAEIMTDRTHLVYGPMESEILLLNIVFPSQGQDSPLTVPVRPVWLNKGPENEKLPQFRLGVEFLEPLPAAIFQRLNRHQR